MTLSAPELVADRHQTADLRCGVPSLDDWLKRRAKANQASRASRMCVACEGDQVVGYYALAAGSVDVANAFVASCLCAERCVPQRSSTDDALLLKLGSRGRSITH